MSSESLPLVAGITGILCLLFLVSNAFWPTLYAGIPDPVRALIVLILALPSFRLGMQRTPDA